jgi:hypothetical protein
MCQGSVHFENLRVKPDVIEEMGLAIEIKHGVVGTLDLQIPWKQLFPTPSKPVKVEIDQIFLVLAARPYTSKDIDKQNQREKDSKKKRVKALSEPVSQGLNEPKDLSFTAKLVTSIVNNIQVRARVCVFLMCACVCVCVCVCVYIYIYIYMCVCVCVCMCMRIFVYFTTRAHSPCRSRLARCTCATKTA